MLSRYFKKTDYKMIRMNFRKILNLFCILFYAQITQASIASFKIIGGIDNSELKAKMEINIISMIDAFKVAADNPGSNVKIDKDHITKNALDDIRKIWKSSAMSCPPVNIITRCLKTSEGYQVRGIPIDMLEADEKEARQELTVDFLPNGIINNVSIAIEMHRYDELMAEKTSDLDYARRQKIISFIEDFRTAYNRRDIKMLTSIYSDKALIITGRIISEKPNSDLTRMTLNNNKVVYIKQDKQQYLVNLEKVFKTTKFLNVKFEDIEIVQHPKYDEIYGVTLKQYWHTNRYSDEGYLFLMVDFRNEDNPIIQVRTWQPYKDKSGNIIIDKKDVFHIGSFRIVR